MSEPVTNAEVEDVLSSIRRLVSEEKRPIQTARPAPVKDRLVLTPSLRVAESEPDAVEQAEDDRDQARSHPLVQPRSVADDLLDNSFFFFERGSHAQATGDDDDDCDEDIDDRDSVDDAYDHVLAEAGDVPRSAASAQDLEEDYESDRYDFVDSDDQGSDDQGEPDEAPLTPTPAVRAALVQLSKAEDDDIDEELHNPVGDAAVSDSKAATLSAKIEALESAIGGIEDSFDPDEPGIGANSGTEAPPLAWEDDEVEDTENLAARFMKDSYEDRHAGAGIPQEPAVASAANPEDDDDDDAGVAFSAEDQLIDEEALRDLVSEIVRAELQGALGERITRNVRKLVRREIHRALTARDLE